MVNIKLTFENVSLLAFLILFFAQGTNSVSSTIYCLLFTNVSVLITKCPFFLFCKELIGLQAPDQIQYSFVFSLLRRRLESLLPSACYAGYFVFIIAMFT